MIPLIEQCRETELRPPLDWENVVLVNAYLQAQNAIDKLCAGKVKNRDRVTRLIDNYLSLLRNSNATERKRITSIYSNSKRHKAEDNPERCS